jgi:PAS domain S-box-containing protein
MNTTSVQAVGRPSITRRLTTSLAITVLVVSVIAVGAMSHVVSLDAARNLERKADETLAFLVGSLEMPLWSFDEKEIRTIGTAVANDESIVRLVIRDQSGVVVYSARKNDAGEYTDRSSHVLHKRGEVDNVVGDVSVSLAQAHFQEGNQQLLLYSMLIIVLILISVAIVSVVFIRVSLNRSLNSLNDVANRFAAGSYDTTGRPLPYVEFQPFDRTLAQMAKKIEEQIRTVRDAEARYRDIFENAMEGIFQATFEGRFLNTNPALLRILGYDSLADLSAGVRDSSVNLYVNPGARNRLLAALREHGAVTGYEVQLRRKDGSVIWVSISARMVAGDAGQPTYLEGFLADISDHKRADEEIHTLNRELELRVAERTAELQAANRELETFSYSVSHDLRTPLRHIDGFLGLLRNRLEATLDDECRHYMATISEAALRMATLIDDLLSFSRSGRFEMCKAPVDLNDLVREIIGEFEPEMIGRTVHWQISELPTVNADRAMLRAVMVNLISNALKFTQPRAQAEIAIGNLPDRKATPADGPGAEPNAETVIYVRDNGVGFDMKYAAKLFGVFERLHSVTDFKGTGIGLANVRRVIGRHGGRTWAEGKVDGGATFYFSLPRASRQSPPVGFQAYSFRKGGTP